MRSIDNLREYALTAASVNATTRAVLAGYIDNIEREVADMVPLPMDADGEAIHVGDVMDSRVDYLFDGKPFTVRALVLCEDGREVADGRFGNRYEPDSLRRHYAPTVEDLLREYALKCEEAGNSGPEVKRLAAEYAARLMLAGEDA